MKLLGVSEREISSVDKQSAKFIYGKGAWLMPILEDMVEVNRPIVPLKESCDIIIITQLRDLKARSLTDLLSQLKDVQQGRTERDPQRAVAVAGVPTVLTTVRRSFGYLVVHADTALQATRAPWAATITSPGGEFTYDFWVVPKMNPVQFLTLFPANSKGNVSPVATDTSTITVPANLIRTDSILTSFNLNAQDI